MRVTLAAAAFLTALLSACSVASEVSYGATPFVIAPPNVCGFGDRQHPFFAWRGWGYCPERTVRT